MFQTIIYHKRLCTTSQPTKNDKISTYRDPCPIILLGGDNFKVMCTGIGAVVTITSAYHSLRLHMAGRHH